MRGFIVVTGYGESRSLFHVVDADAPEGEQPAVQASYLTREAANISAAYLNAIRSILRAPRIS